MVTKIKITTIYIILILTIVGCYQYSQNHNRTISNEIDTYNKTKDSDGDGVSDDIDKCPKTPYGAQVDKETGCPLDSDGDGVPDFEDVCPSTPRGAYADANGCPFDSDMDGVYNGIDKCPNSPIGTSVNEFGCERTKADYANNKKQIETKNNYNSDRNSYTNPDDSDGDGVPDFEDACPNTPRGAYIDANGCPFDSDMDGVYDGIDKCPNTAVTAFFVDKFGCETSTDELNDLVGKLYAFEYLNSANFKYKIGDITGAINDYCIALYINGIQNMQNGNYKSAIEDFSNIIDMNPNIPEVYNNLGWAIYNEGKTMENISEKKRLYSKAIKSFQKAIQLDPYFENAKINLKIVNIELKNCIRNQK